MFTERKSSIALMNIHRDRGAVTVNFFFLFFSSDSLTSC